MEIKLTVRAEIIAALKLFAADKDVRFYLNGINLEIGRKETRLVAADGVMLGCFRVESEQPDVDAPLTNIIIPNDLLKPIKAKGMVEILIGPLETKKDAKGEEVPVSSARPVTLTYADVSMSSKTLDGIFPDWRRAIPSKVSGEAAQFDPAYVGLLAKVAAALYGKSKYVGIGFNGDDAALLDFGDENFVGVLMPLRPNVVTAPRTPPDWWADSLRIATDPVADLV